MKRQILLVWMTMLMLTSMAWAQTWYPTNQVRVAWDAVTTLNDNTPIPSGQTVTYTVFVRAGNPDGPTSEGVTISETSAIVGFTVPGRYYIGIKASLMEGTTKLAESTISWSYDESIVQGGKIFGIIFSRPPGIPKNLRIVQ